MHAYQTSITTDRLLRFTLLILAGWIEHVAYLYYRLFVLGDDPDIDFFNSIELAATSYPAVACLLCVNWYRVWRGLPITPGDALDLDEELSRHNLPDKVGESPTGSV